MTIEEEREKVTKELVEMCIEEVKEDQTELAKCKSECAKRIVDLEKKINTNKNFIEVMSKPRSK